MSEKHTNTYTCAEGTKLPCYTHVSVCLGGKDSRRRTLHKYTAMCARLRECVCCCVCNGLVNVSNVDRIVAAEEGNGVGVSALVLLSIYPHVA